MTDHEVDQAGVSTVRTRRLRKGQSSTLDVHHLRGARRVPPADGSLVLKSRDERTWIEMTTPIEEEASDPHPYSLAFSAAGLVFVSGALSVGPDYVAVPGRREALDAALDRMTERMATEGATLADVVKLTYFVTDVSLRKEANQQYESVFSTPRPARTFVGVNALPYGATVEIDCIALAR